MHVVYCEVILDLPYTAHGHWYAQTLRAQNV
jgi:hypothetical protein